MGMRILRCSLSGKGNSDVGLHEAQLVTALQLYIKDKY